MTTNSPSPALPQASVRPFSFTSLAAQNTSSAPASSGTQSLSPVVFVSQASTNSNSVSRDSDDSGNNSSYDSAYLFPPMKNTSSVNPSSFTALNSGGLDAYYDNTFDSLLGTDLLDENLTDPFALAALPDQFPAVDENGDPIPVSQDGNEDPSTQTIQYVDGLIGSQPAAGLAALAGDALQGTDFGSSSTPGAASNSSSSDSSATA